MRIEKRGQSFGDQVTADFRRTGHIGSAWDGKDKALKAVRGIQWRQDTETHRRIVVLRSRMALAAPGSSEQGKGD